MSSRWIIPRRTAIKGLGASLLLPLLDQMGWAETPKSAKRPPVRLCYIYIPYGVHPEHFWPSTTNDIGNLSQILEPLRPVINKVMPIYGLDLLRDLDVGGGGMGGHHANEVAAWLSGRMVKQNDPNNAITADQVAANALGHFTSLPSLQLSFEKATRSDTFDKGFNGAFFEHVSWRSESVAMPNEINPRAVFDRLFSARKISTRRNSPALTGTDTSRFTVNENEEQSSTVSLDQSMLDLLREGSADLRKQLGVGDQRKLDGYLDSVRALEKRIQSIERQQLDQERESEKVKPWKTSPPLVVNVPPTIPKTFKEYAQVMLDILALAFQSDTTRVSTVMFGKPFGGSYPELGFADKHHEVSHWRENKEDRLAKVLKINVNHTQQLAYFLKRLESLKEGTGSVLDNSMIVYGSGMTDGANHDHKNLPTLLCGKGGGTIRTGRILKTQSTPICNLHLALLARLGVNAKSMGDSTGMLDLG